MSGGLGVREEGEGISEGGGRRLSVVGRKRK